MHVPQTEVILRVGGVELARTLLPPGDYVIGRSDDVEIYVDAPTLSRRHAQLTINYDHLVIEDLGSSYGTFVNEEKIEEPTRLFPNQTVRLGDVTVELHRSRPSSDGGASLAPAQEAIRRYLPDELLETKRYAIGKQIAKGGMGAILTAQQTTIDRTVAMKVMLGLSDEVDVVRFIDEAKITGQLEHPNIVPIYELGVDEQDQLFYTMKLVRGITLKKVIELLRKGFKATESKYTLATLLTIFQKVCDAVAFAHSKGVLHRDLKPENIMIGDFGSVLVMDWGLAKVMGPNLQGTEAPAMTLGSVMSVRMTSQGVGGTQAGAVLGTPQYMAPEQARGEISSLDARADIYALGAILFEILHLRPTVAGSDPWEIVHKVAQGKVEWDQKRNPRVPDGLLAVCRKALEFDPGKRYASVEELQQDLTAYQNGFATRAENAGFGKQLLLAVRRNKGAALAAAAVVVVGAVFGTQALLEGRRAEREAAVAKATLADLRRTAPVFAEQAKVKLEEGNLEEAMEKIGYAIQLDETQPDYPLFRANLLQSSQQMAEATEAYRRVLALRPADAVAQVNLALCEKLMLESGGGPLNPAQQNILLTALRKQRRLVEAAPLAAVLDPDRASTRAAMLARLREARGFPGWSDNFNLRDEPDGTFYLHLWRLAAIDFSVLRGMPITKLNIGLTGISDLSSLVGLPLRELLIEGCKVTDLTPLKDLPLEVLDLASNPVTDLSPLRGMKLRKLRLLRTPVTDLTPLAGMPLTDLDIFECKQITNYAPLRELPLLRSLNVFGGNLVDLTLLSSLVHLEELAIGRNPCTDLRPLAGLKLTTLSCYDMKITSLAPLRGMPLRNLNFALTAVTDAEPLADCPMLEDLAVPFTPVKLEALRKHPNLKHISRKRLGDPPRPTQTAAEFWQEYDAQAKR